jgi:hypothetical protein
MQFTSILKSGGETYHKLEKKFTHKCKVQKTISVHTIVAIGVHTRNAGLSYAVVIHELKCETSIDPAEDTQASISFNE